MRRNSGYAALIMAFVLVVAACGDDDGSSLIEQSSGTAAPSSTINPLDVIPTDVGDLPGVSGECEALLNLFISIGGAFLGGEVSPLNAGVLSGLPPELRNDAQFVSDTMRQFSASMQELGVDFTDPSSLAALTPAQQEAFSTLSDSLDSEQFTTATDNLSAYGEQQCGDQFNPGG